MGERAARDAPVVKRPRDERACRAERAETRQVARVAHAARRKNPFLSRMFPRRAKSPEIGAGAGTHPRQTHNNDAPRPKLGGMGEHRGTEKTVAAIIEGKNDPVFRAGAHAPPV